MKGLRLVVSSLRLLADDCVLERVVEDVVNFDAIKEYLLSKPEAQETYPFDDKTAVFKVQNKMFALLITRQGQPLLNLKCDPLDARELRDIFEEVIPAYHMNKRHWNSIILDGNLPIGEVQRQIDHSYALVVKGMKKSVREGLEVRYGSDVIYQA